MIKKQMPMYLNSADPKIKIFRDFRVFVLSPIPKGENSEITEIYQKPQNTEIWECNFKNPWIIVQMTSFSKWSSHLANHVPYVSRDSDNCRFVKLSLFFCLFVCFVYFSFNTQKVKIVIKNRSTFIRAL